ncbi:PREDICTED: putative uncharacterized protein DDB_G0277255 isoform X1 [Rhagoletis zephyria]|uniref:putative uncharacterized protein DDB_G0277255 isoform X1 n=1 Tax=Rhagoletis zephyria TaxID=28612 RepID=UPI00081178BA|nr:PREDICTED: putative uncharacterized protein DDB_G0277255 isoform X1 [Rhagoletis zephyria]
MLSRYGERSRSPVFGRVISREPLIPQRVTIGHRQRHYGIDGSIYGSSSPRVYGAESKSTSTSHVGAGGGSARRPSKYRYVGASDSTLNGANGGNTNSVNVQGSFQRLKELIWTERAKELTQQRRAEEMAARAAVLKEIANGKNTQSSYKHPVKSESPLMDENRSPDRDIYQHLNDGRMSIATGQSRYIESNYNNKKDRSNNNANSNNDNNNNRYNTSKSVYNNQYNYKGNGRTGTSNANNNGRDPYRSSSNSNGSLASSLRSYMNINRNRNNKNYGKQKSFPPLATGYVGSSVATSQTSNYFDDEHSMGIPRAYPVRPSHFRERNRAIFKEDSPLEKTAETDYFSRQSRSQQQLNIPSKERVLLKGIIQDFNRHTSTSAIAPEYMENYTNNKSRIEAEAAPATSADDLYTDELDIFARPSMDKGALSNNMDKVDDTFSVEEPLAPNIKGWNELDLADANIFLNYVKPHAGYPAKEAAEPLELYYYGNFY